MARVDELAAKQEIEKAEQCQEQADMLAHVADELKREALRHLDEADQLRGAVSGAPPA